MTSKAKPYGDPRTFKPPARIVSDDLDMEQVIVKSPTHSDWPDAYYGDLHDLTVKQLAATDARLAQIKAEQVTAQERMTGIRVSLITSWDDPEARDRLVASLIANRLLWDELPALINLLEKRRSTLDRYERELRNHKHARAWQAEREAAAARKMAEEKERAATEEALRTAAWLAQMDPERRAEIKRDEQAKIERAEREALRREQQEADRKAEAERLQTAAEWVKGVLDGTG